MAYEPLELSPDDPVSRAVEEFELSNSSAKKEIEIFMDRHAEDVKLIDSLVTVRNDALVEAKRAMRAKAIEQRSSFEVGPFKVTRVPSLSFDPEPLLELLRKDGLYDKALEAGAVVIKTEVNYKAMAHFLRNRSLWAKAAAFEKVEEKTPRVEGAKPLRFLAEAD